MATPPPPPPPPRAVVVAVDVVEDLEGARKAVEYAATTVRLRKADELVVLHVAKVEDPAFDVHIPGTAGGVTFRAAGADAAADAAIARAKELVTAKLVAPAEALLCGQCGVRAHVVPANVDLGAGGVGRLVLNQLAGLGASLVVVCRHGKSRAEEVFLGSTTAFLVHNSTVPVCVLPPAA